MTSPLPDIDGMLRRVANAKFKSLLDLKNAYEQIISEHVERSAVTTPDGNMVSFVVQLGDCNAPATYQALMNHFFSPYIGRFLNATQYGYGILFGLEGGLMGRRVAFWGENKQGSEGAEPLDSHFLYEPRLTPFFLSLG